MRQVLGDGRWFDKKKARPFEESTHWNGSNHISDATGSQWRHETLYRTAGGAWVPHRSSQWQGEVDSWNAIDDDAAARWLVRNGHDDPDVPATADAMAALEVT